MYLMSPAPRRWAASRLRPGRALLVATAVLLGFVLLCVTAGLSPALADELTADQEALAKKLEGRLIAPCCYTQTVDVHESESAEMIKSQIRMMVAQGKSEDEILDTFVEQYGDTILAAPRASGFNLVAYVLPLVVALVAAAAVAFLVVRWRRGAASEEAVPQPVVSSRPDARAASEDEVQARLEQELKEFDR